MQMSYVQGPDRVKADTGSVVTGVWLSHVTRILQVANGEFWKQGWAALLYPDLNGSLTLSSANHSHQKGKLFLLFFQCFSVYCQNYLRDHLCFGLRNICYLSSNPTLFICVFVLCFVLAVLTEPSTTYSLTSLCRLTLLLLQSNPHCSGRCHVNYINKLSHVPHRWSQYILLLSTFYKWWQWSNTWQQLS